jgi:hypothetical protein
MHLTKKPFLIALSQPEGGRAEATLVEILDQVLLCCHFVHTVSGVLEDGWCGLELARLIGKIDCPESSFGMSCAGGAMVGSLRRL